MSNTLNPYQVNAVMTASPQQLTLMLFDGAIKFCNLAIEGIEEKNIEKANNNIIKVEKIIEELNITLDRKCDVTNEIALLYDYMHRLLEQANIKKDAEMVLECKDLVVQFRDMWKEVIKLTK